MYKKDPPSTLDGQLPELINQVMEEILKFTDINDSKVSNDDYPSKRELKTVQVQILMTFGCLEIKFCFPVNCDRN